MTREFLDTNVLVYAFSQDPRSRRAEEILARRCDTSVQNLNEFTNVAHRKLAMSWEEIRTGIDAIETVCTAVHSVDTTVIRQGLLLAERYRLAIYDALVVACALAANCDVFYSEDMQHGQIIEGRLRICNPFIGD
jgi:predicted nucleic acid-binding protein